MKKTKVIILILLITTIALVSYIVIDKTGLIGKNNKTVANTEENEESEENELPLQKITIDEIKVNEEIEEQLSCYRNIAIFGVDARTDTYDHTRSDCIMIASINDDTKEIKLFSVYRDTYVNIQGHGYDKINHAYAYGGPELAINTLNENFDLDIKEFVTFNFDAFVEVIDAVGGIEIKIENDELKYINNIKNEIDKQLNKSTPDVTETGAQILSGVQALAYSRIRYTNGGDYKRTERMRDVLKATYAKAKTLSIGKLSNLANVLLPEVATNISSSEIVGLLPKIAQYNFTISKGWPYKVEDKTIDGIWYGIPVTLESNVKKLHEDLFGDENYEVSSKVKEYSEDIVKKTEGK